MAELRQKALHCFNCDNDNVTMKMIHNKFCFQCPDCGNVISIDDRPYFWREDKADNMTLCTSCDKKCPHKLDRWVAWKLPARTIKMYDSTLNLYEGCNYRRAELLKDIVAIQKKKSTITLKGEQIYHRREGVSWGCHEPTIDILVDGELKASINGDYKHGMIRDTMKPYITKVRVGRKVATLDIGEADRVIQQAVASPAITERSEKKMPQKPNNHKRRQILDFARDHNLVIHPGGGYEYYIKNFFDLGHCPCAKERLECPCPESIEEVKNDGWCKCHLFWRDLDTYKESHVREY